MITDGLPSAPLALNMALQIAGALSHAHDRRIVHGDLKTANVLILDGTRVNVVDFGLARRHQGGTEGMTQSSFSGGTPYTSAPEQLRGVQADTRSDVWALGVLLQELTSGTRPFWRPNLAELFAAILTESPAAVPSHVNPALRRIIERCLARGVREAIGRRLTRLSDECNRALGLAAIVGREFTLPVLLALSDMSEGALLDVIDEASAARLVHAVPGVSERYTFTHALVRDTLYGELTPARRSRLHRQVAEVLDTLSAGGDRPLADLAYHYAHAASASDAHKAIECAVGAAERAAASFALEEAARFYEIALQAADLLPVDPSLRATRFDLHFRRGKAFTDVGLWGPARAELEAALPLVDRNDTARRTQGTA